MQQFGRCWWVGGWGESQLSHYWILIGFWGAKSGVKLLVGKELKRRVNSIRFGRWWLAGRAGTWGERRQGGDSPRSRGGHGEGRVGLAKGLMMPVLVVFSVVVSIL